MNELSQDLSEQGLAAANEANMFSMFPLFARWPQMEAHDDPDLAWSITNVPSPLFNSVLRARLLPETVDATIEQVIEQARSRNVPILWRTGPTTTPTDIGERLLAHGWIHVGDAPGMGVDLLALNEAQATPPDLRIQRVDSMEMLKQWCQVVTDGFEMPAFVGDALFDVFTCVGMGEQQPLQNYLGVLDGNPVAASSLVLGGGVAGIYNVATLPGARGRGIGAAMTLAPLKQARASGYRIGVLQSSPMGYKVYSRLGFREVCRIGDYLWTNEPHS